MARVPLREPLTSATAYVGGIRMRLWTWSCTRGPATMVRPRCPANARHPGASNVRILPYNACFRPVGINTTCYVQSHWEWLRLAYDAVVMPYAPCGPPSPLRAYDTIICHDIWRPSLERLPGQTRALPVRELWLIATNQIAHFRPRRI
jgi:hypothetical protein